MSEFKLKEKCSINSNMDSDKFVGIKCEKGDYSIHFPLGFRIAETDKELRRDIILLFNSIKKTTKMKKSESETYNEFIEYSQLDFLFQAYLAVIYDFYNRGYYHEQEVIYNISKRGKVNWSRTIKTQKPYLQDEQVFYLNFITTRKSINENEMITLIHEYCVYESFKKIGWLFTSKLPARPKLKFNYKLFKSILIQKLYNTFNDTNKTLFRNMLAIIDYEGEENNRQDYYYGTYRYEYVWECMIDRIFGICNKEKFFPKTSWKLNDMVYSNSKLKPDSVMITNDHIYILDAKYYKYGQTKNPKDLPKSTSINKQITYGEYVAENEKFDYEYGEKRIVYNAFIMPFDSKNSKWKLDSDIFSIGEGVSDWKTGSKPYEHVQGILIDIKHLIYLDMQSSVEEMMHLAKCIENSVENMKDE